MYNKVEDNWHLSNKKALFLNMSHYYEKQGIDPFRVLPVTYFIKSLDDPNFQKFKEHFERASEGEANAWIIKPGENTNRGSGIDVSN